MGDERDKSPEFLIFYEIVFPTTTVLGNIVNIEYFVCKKMSNKK